jgi:hypothetical protein
MGKEASILHILTVSVKAHVKDTYWKKQKEVKKGDR